MIDNYLIAETLIMDRLRDTLEGVKVLSSSQLSGITEKSQIVPAVHVIYAGDKLDDETKQSRSNVFVRQRWMVVLAVRNNRKIEDGSPCDNSQAGEYLLKILRSLTGYPLSDDHNFLRRESSPTPQYANNFAYFPLLFSTKILTDGYLT